MNSENLDRRNLKGLLLEYCQKEGIPLPSFSYTKDPDSSDHQPFWSSTLRFADGRTFTGSYCSKKVLADNNVSHIAMQYIMDDSRRDERKVVEWRYDLTPVLETISKFKGDTIVLIDMRTVTLETVTHSSNRLVIGITSEADIASTRKVSYPKYIIENADFDAVASTIIFLAGIIVQSRKVDLYLASSNSQVMKCALHMSSCYNVFPLSADDQEILVNLRVKRN